MKNTEKIRFRERRPKQSLRREYTEILSSKDIKNEKIVKENHNKEPQ